MRTYYHGVAGDTVTINVPQRGADLDAFKAWFTRAAARGPIALDTETTGLDIYRPGYRLRTVQFGDAHTAWVIHYERGGEFAETARRAFRQDAHFVIHNAPFDWLVLDRHAGVPLEQLAKVTTDTKILASLVDPRPPQDGGIGQSLKPLSAHYVDPEAQDTQAGLYGEFRAIGKTKETGWAAIDLDNQLYNLYAGLDVIYTARLRPKLVEKLQALGVRERLSQYEHELARICSIMTRAGMVLDVDHTQTLNAHLAEEAAKFAQRAARYGVDNVNAPTQIAAALLGMGEELTERTPSGALKLDKAVMLALADLTPKWERIGARQPNPLAEAVLRAKRAGKWRSTYADRMLSSVDDEGRIHPSIHTLAARTGRMSVTGDLAAQTLPSSDWMIRRCILADEGHVWISTDFQAVELRVLAALADVRRMKAAIASGQDLHNFTASLVYGEGFTEYHRKVCKGIGFGKVYGGGAATVSRQTGAPVDQVMSAMRIYDSVYPEIKRASTRWQREARMSGMVHISATGRRLPLDRDRMYAVVNYACQSAARDLLGQALLDAEAAGLLPYMRLPIHDEILASAPAEDAEEIARAFEKAMTFDLMGVPIEAEAEVGGRSWGSLYGADY